MRRWGSHAFIRLPATVYVLLRWHSASVHVATGWQQPLSQLVKKNASDAITTSDSEQTNSCPPPRIPCPPPWTEHLMDRSVSIRCTNRHDNDNDNGLPLQIYRAQLRKTVASKNPDATERAENANANLSKSSSSRLEKHDSLSPTQQRQLYQKIQKEQQAATPLDRHQHLHILYLDDHICVCVKESGILSVPGPRRNPSLAGLLWDVVQPWQIDTMDQMIVHRLDMDTSGIIVYALSHRALSQLHDDFRQRRIHKQYQALLVGHLDVAEMEVALDLERDPQHPPFMRIAQPRPQTNQPNEKISTTCSSIDVDATFAANRHGSFQKMIQKAAKPSLTTLSVLSWEYLSEEYPVTRVQLTPHTGRTHQLRVHCAAQCHAIVGDDIYGHCGEGVFGGGSQLQELMTPSQLQLHRDIHQLLKQDQGLDCGHLPQGLCLHAEQLSLRHPLTGTPMMFQADPTF
jgi:tRNA pseudouridine32 synthase / 23S rRNA pseudouridine746 synthase